MRNIPFLSVLVIFLLLSQACNYKQPTTSVDQQETEKDLRQERFEAINNQLLSDENCIIYDSTEVFNSLEDFLKLERFKGKVVYLDFWEIGCKPCLNEFAYLPELKEKFKQEPIEYIYVTTIRENAADAFYEKVWRTRIEKYQLTGVNVRISGDAKRRFYERHRNIVDPEWAKLIPVYLLINKEGTVINYVAPRPSSKEILYAEIQEMLEN